VELKTIACVNYALFECGCGACVDNCCRVNTWRIDIDNDSYVQYERKFTDGDFGAYLKKNIEKDDLGYFFKKGKDGNCPMLAEDKLCRLYKNYGPDYLSLTCASFPRSFNIYSGFCQKFLSLGCPPAAEMILLQKDGLEFGIFNDGQAIGDEYFRQPDADAPSKPDAGLCFKIRGKCTNILSARDVPLPVRLTLIGAMFNALEKLCDEPGFNSKTETILKAYENRVHDNETARALSESLKTGDAIKDLLYPQLADLLKALAKNAEYIPDVNTDFYTRVNTYFTVQPTDRYKNIAGNKKAVTDPFLREHEYICTNYIVYYMFYSRFPYESENLCAAYKKCLIEFLLLIVLAACLYGDKPVLEIPDFINCISYFSRIIMHSTKYKTLMANFLSKTESMDCAMLVCAVNY